MPCEPAQRAARPRRCAVPHSCVCTAARRRWCGLEGPLTIRSGAPPGPGTPCQWNASRRRRTSPHGMARYGPDSGRRHGQGPQTPECRRDPADAQQQAWHVCRRRRRHRQAIRAGLLQHTRPPLHPGHHRSDTRVCRPGPGRWCRPPGRPGCLLCASHRSEHKQEMRAPAPVSSRRAGTGPRGPTRWLALCMVPLVSTQVTMQCRAKGTGRIMH
jgi:hypothetical protein